MKPRKFCGFSPRETLVFSSWNPVCLTSVNLFNIPHANNGEKYTKGIYMESDKIKALQLENAKLKKELNHIKKMWKTWIPTFDIMDVDSFIEIRSWLR